VGRGCRRPLFRRAPGGTHESSTVKVICSEAIWRVVDRSMQILGRLGITDDTNVARLFREVRPFRIYDGPSEVHRWSIARRVLRAGGGGIVTAIDATKSIMVLAGPRPNPPTDALRLFSAISNYAPSQIGRDTLPPTGTFQTGSSDHLSVRRTATRLQ